MSGQHKDLSDLDPDIQKFSEFLSAGYGQYGSIEALAPEDLREVCSKVRHPLTLGGPKMASTTEILVSFDHYTVPIRVYSPHGMSNQPALIYLHGGGWTVFSIDTHDRIMREYAERAGIAVIGVDYSLSPEAKFPKALYEITGVVKWIKAHANKLGIDSARLAIGGDSAGANLTVSACVALREEGELEGVQAMLLNYGAYGGSYESLSHRKYGSGGYILDTVELKSFWDNYLGRSRDKYNQLARPILAELHALPSAFLCIPECDILYSENILMYQRLVEAGVDTDYIVYQGATHSFLEAVSMATVAETALQDGARWLRTKLSNLLSSTPPAQ